MVWLHLGSVNTIVILSTKTVIELFKNHDFSFADRNIIKNLRVLKFDKGSLSLAPYANNSVQFDDLSPQRC